jgi:hypothetical protein
MEKGAYRSGDNRSNMLHQNEVGSAIAHLKAKGIEDWEILDIWSKIVYEQGNYAIADVLASAAFRVGKPVE